jgi:hypothetical protein
MAQRSEICHWESGVRQPYEPRDVHLANSCTSTMCIRSRGQPGGNPLGEAEPLPSGLLGAVTMTGVQGGSPARPAVRQREPRLQMGPDTDQIWPAPQPDGVRPFPWPRQIKPITYLKANSAEVLLAS